MDRRDFLKATAAVVVGGSVPTTSTIFRPSKPFYGTPYWEYPVTRKNGDVLTMIVSVKKSTPAGCLEIDWVP